MNVDIDRRLAIRARKRRVLLVSREARRRSKAASNSKRRRDRLRAEGRCVNDTNARAHGAPVKGGKCASCYAAAK